MKILIKWPGSHWQAVSLISAGCAKKVAVTTPPPLPPSTPAQAASRFETIQPQSPPASRQTGSSPKLRKRSAIPMLSRAPVSTSCWLGFKMHISITTGTVCAPMH